jgi:hypothetical protein
MGYLGRYTMPARLRHDRGFTLLEVTFASGITLLAFVLVLGSIVSISLARETGERRQAATICLNHCIEQLHGATSEEAAALRLSPPTGLAGKFEIQPEYLDAKGEVLPAPSGAHAVRVTVKTGTARGHALQGSAVYVLEGARHAS